MSILAFLAMFGGFVQANDWGYEATFGTTPKDWGKEIAPQCEGTHQSPIDVTGSKYRDFPPLNFGPTVESDVKFEDNGHSVQATVSDPSLHELSGGPLDETYLLQQMHFHWGNDAGVGSEHFIEGRQFPLEGHFVFFNGRFGDFGTAAASGESDALVVVTVMFEISHENPVIQLLQHPNNWPTHDDEKSIKRFDFGGLLAQTKPENFYTYLGSLTTPGCDEIVRWIIMKDTAPISERQLRHFRDVTHHGEKVTHNFRNLQPHNGRDIFRSWPEGDRTLLDSADFTKDMVLTGRIIAASGTVAFGIVAIGLFLRRKKRSYQIVQTFVEPEP